MAQDATKFTARKIREKFQELNPANDPHKAVWLMTVDNELEESKAGSMMAAYVGHTRNSLDPLPPHVFTVCRCIVEGTHRLATDEEIEQHNAKQAAQRERLKKEEQDKKLTINNQMGIPPELLAAFMAWQASTQMGVTAEAKPAKKSK